MASQTRLTAPGAQAPRSTVAQSPERRSRQRRRNLWIYALAEFVGPRRSRVAAITGAFVDRGLTEVIQDDDEVWSRIDQRGERRQLLVPNAGVESEPARSGGLQTRGELREDGRGQVLQEMPDADHAACPHQCVQLIDNAT